MANKTLFSSIKSLLPRATERNEAGGAAYALAPKHALGEARIAETIPGLAPQGGGQLCKMPKVTVAIWIWSTEILLQPD
jgi:hypothetical protein